MWGLLYQSTAPLWTVKWISAPSISHIPEVSVDRGKKMIYVRIWTGKYSLFSYQIPCIFIGPRSDHCLILSVIHSVTLSCRRQTKQSYTVSRRFVRMDVLSGRYFLRTALDVLAGRHLSATLVKVVTCFCQSCCWIWSPFRVRQLAASPLCLWQCFLPRLLWRVEKENKWINGNGALLSQWRGQTI